MKWIFLILICFIFLVVLRRRQRSKAAQQASQSPLEPDVHELLLAHVPFYKKLGEEQQQQFRKRVQHFLAHVTITPVSTTLTELDKIYIGASAIIPIFHFSDWAYNNLNEILVYPDAFDHDFAVEGQHRNIGGMVGDGSMHRMMILSRSALRAGFALHPAGNTAIHEFVHLLDKADGATDGVPEYMIPKELVKPWIDLMYHNIQSIKEGRSDLNPYAATNQAEFLAVLSEYFFQKPGFLKEHHPQLYNILEQTYQSQE